MSSIAMGPVRPGPGQIGRLAGGKQVCVRSGIYGLVLAAHGLAVTSAGCSAYMDAARVPAGKRMV